MVVLLGVVRFLQAKRPKEQCQNRNPSSTQISRLGTSPCIPPTREVVAKNAAKGLKSTPPNSFNMSECFINSINSSMIRKDRDGYGIIWNNMEYMRCKSQISLLLFLKSPALPELPPVEILHPAAHRLCTHR